MKRLLRDHPKAATAGLQVADTVLHKVAMVVLRAVDTASRDMDNNNNNHLLKEGTASRVDTDNNSLKEGTGNRVAMDSSLRAAMDGRLREDIHSKDRVVTVPLLLHQDINLGLEPIVFPEIGRPRVGTGGTRLHKTEL